MKQVIVGVLVIFLWWETAAGVLAGWQGDMSCEFSQERYRTDLGMAVLLALIPPFWLITPFVTGFYQYGWQWNLGRRKC